MILKFNLHGIDIDLRSTQIAALALWSRARRSYQELGLSISDHPRITRGNLVHAASMPGELGLLEEVVNLQPLVLRQLVREIFQSMELAHEAGSLLRIERELEDAITEARRQWNSLPVWEQMLLFGEQGVKPTVPPRFSLNDVTNETFWDLAKDRVLEGLRLYAQEVTSGQGYTRCLFAEDAAQGFGFIDICNQEYDVVLMNPPFGQGTVSTKPYIDMNYPRTRHDVFATFIERGLELLNTRGFLGAITSRSGFFLSSFETWREELLLRESRPTVVADLGQGVLDTAMVETAAYVLERTP